ncbi:CPBP family intramembrane glutamic endopeptidase [Nocardiopsis valliformis]|uniref:CPBP family intramembrane glutamic endopeptidase n=1 Tax=Nocardiopsis valliformis TaxID=239974 RepID=UPI00034C6FC2|nr:CPBP family intramembrane glutamic endopeptidase [Nocardiopsis valliformis]
MVLRSMVISGAVGAGLFLVLITLAIDPQLRQDVMYGGGYRLLVSWGPAVAAGVLAGLLAVYFGRRRELDTRVRQALTTQPVHRQLIWLGCCLVACVVAIAGLYWVLSALGPGADASTTAPISLVPRVLFFLALPAIAIDRLITILRAEGTGLSEIAMKVTEPWRWLGLTPVLLAIMLVSFLLAPFRVGWPPLVLMVGVLAVFLVAALCEEAFFRVMVQTRLELLWGRWAGIITTSLLFALFYALIQPYLVLIPLPGDTFVHHLGMALLTYTPIGLLCGYLWACYRNIWLNTLLRTGLFFLAYPPPGQ